MHSWTFCKTTKLNVFFFFLMVTLRQINLSPRLKPSVDALRWRSILFMIQTENETTNRSTLRCNVFLWPFRTKNIFFYSAKQNMRLNFIFAPSSMETTQQCWILLNWRTYFCLLQELSRQSLIIEIDSPLMPSEKIYVERTQWEWLKNN